MSTNHRTKVLVPPIQFQLSCSILIVNRGIVSPTLNVNPTLFVNSSKKHWGIIGLQCCNYYHLPSDFPSKFQSSMIIVHHKLPTREGRVLTTRWTHPSYMIVFVNLFIRSVIRKVCHSDIKYHMTLIMISSVVLLVAHIDSLELNLAHVKSLIIKLVWITWIHVVIVLFLVS